jgi:WD repeat-containing protein 23
MSSGTCTVHSWNDGAEDDEAEPKMGLRVNQRLVADPIYHDRLGLRDRPFWSDERRLGARRRADDSDDDENREGWNSDETEA